MTGGDRRPPQLNGTVCGCNCRCSNVVCGPGDDQDERLIDDGGLNGVLYDESIADGELVDAVEGSYLQGDQGVEGFEMMEDSAVGEENYIIISTPCGFYRVVNGDDFELLEDDDERTLWSRDSTTMYTHYNASMSVVAYARGSSRTTSRESIGMYPWSTNQMLFGIGGGRDDVLPASRRSPSEHSLNSPPPETETNYASHDTTANGDRHLRYQYPRELHDDDLDMADLSGGAFGG